LRAKLSGMSDVSYTHEEIKEQIKFRNACCGNPQMEINLIS
jgi:hypothetical protein